MERWLFLVSSLGSRFRSWVPAQISYLHFSSLWDIAGTWGWDPAAREIPGFRAETLNEAELGMLLVYELHFFLKVQSNTLGKDFTCAQSWWWWRLWLKICWSLVVFSKSIKVPWDRISAESPQRHLRYLISHLTTLILDFLHFCCTHFGLLWLIHHASKLSIFPSAPAPYFNFPLCVVFEAP